MLNELNPIIDDLEAWRQEALRQEKKIKNQAIILLIIFTILLVFFNHFSQKKHDENIKKLQQLQNEFKLENYKIDNNSSKYSFDTDSFDYSRYHHDRLLILELDKEGKKTDFIVIILFLIVILIFVDIFFNLNIINFLVKNIKKDSILQSKLNNKKLIIQKILNSLSKDLTYFPDARMSSKRYIESKLFFQHLSSFWGDDLIKGKVDGVEVVFCEVKAKSTYQVLEALRILDIADSFFSKTVFHGIFYVARFPKILNYETFIYPRTLSESMRKNYHLDYYFPEDKFKVIKTDYPEFEKNFIVYSQHHVESRFVLTHTFMENILKLKKTLKTDISISFQQGNVYLAFSFNKDLFETNIHESISKQIKEEYLLLKRLVSIVSILKLNSIIWKS